MAANRRRKQCRGEVEDQLLANARWSGLYDLPTLHLWRRSALPHEGELQPQAEAASTGAAPKEALQALGTDVAEASGLGTRSGLVVSPFIAKAFGLCDQHHTSR